MRSGDTVGVSNSRALDAFGGAVALAGAWLRGLPVESPPSPPASLTLPMIIHRHSQRSSGAADISFLVIIAIMNFSIFRRRCERSG
jgi:hypothetical protein